MGGVSAIGRRQLIFVPPGMKTNATSYCELILEPILKDLGLKMFQGQSFIFQQDGSPAYTANITHAWLQQNIPEFIRKDEWPPYSPDLNPMDFSIRSILETKACANSHSSIESLKRSFTRAWEQIPQETIRAAVEAFPRRLRAVIQKKGGYIE